MLTTKISENGGRAPDAIPYMPAGLHYIHATVNGKEGRRAVMVDQEACARLQADLEGYFAKVKAGKRARPVVYFDHRQGAAAGHPKRFVWCEGKGILLEMEDWTAAGRTAVEGGDYGYVSPAFRMGRDSHTVLGLVDGVEVASLVNDPAFEEIDCIAAAKAGAAAPAGGGEEGACGVDYINAGNPEGCNQFAHAPGCKHGTGRFVALGDTVGLQERLDDEVEPVEIEFEPERKRGKEWVNDAMEYYLDSMAGKSISLGKTGYTLHIKDSRSRAKLATYNASSQGRNAAFRSLNEGFSRSYHIGSSEAVDRPRQSEARTDRVKHTATFERFAFPARINGENHVIWFVGQTRNPGDKGVLFAEFGVAKAEGGSFPLTESSSDGGKLSPSKVILGEILSAVNGKIKDMPEIVRKKGEDVQAAAKAGAVAPAGGGEEGACGVDYINAGNPEGCNQFAHAPGCKHGSGRFVALGDTVGLQERLDDEVEPVEIEFEPEGGVNYIKAAKEYIKLHLAGREFEVGKTGYKLTVPSTHRVVDTAVKGVRKSQQHKAEFVKRLEDVFSKAYLLSKEAPLLKEGASGQRNALVKKSHAFLKFGYPVKINRQPYMGWFCANQFDAGKPKSVQFYEFGLQKCAGAALFRSVQQQAEVKLLSAAPARKVTLGDYMADVKVKNGVLPEIVRKKGEDVQAAAVLPPRGEVEKGRPGGHNRDTPSRGCKEELKIMNGELLKLLGLPDDADAAAACAAVKKILGERDAHKRKADEVEAEGKKKEEELKAAKADAAAMRVNKLVASGLLAPKDEERIEAARNLAMGDPAAFDAVFAGHVLAGGAAPAEVAGKVPPVPDMERMSLAEMLDKEQ